MTDKEPKPVLRDDGTLNPTHYESLPPMAKNHTTGAPVLLTEVQTSGGTVVKHYI